MGDLGAIVGVAVDDNESRLGVLKGGDVVHHRGVADRGHGNGHRGLGRLRGDGGAVLGRFDIEAAGRGAIRTWGGSASPLAPRRR